VNQRRDGDKSAENRAEQTALAALNGPRRRFLRNGGHSACSVDEYGDPQ